MIPAHRRTNLWRMRACGKAIPPKVSNHEVMMRRKVETTRRRTSQAQVSGLSASVADRHSQSV